MKLFILYKGKEDKGFYEKNISEILVKEKFFSDLMNYVVGVFTTEEFAEQAKAEMNEPKEFNIHSIEFK